MKNISSTLVPHILAGTAPNFTTIQILFSTFPAGYNLFYLTTPKNFQRGSIATVTLSNGASLIINQNAGGLYSDYNLTSQSVLNTNASDPKRWCFYFNLLPMRLMNASINISKNYTAPGNYNLTVNVTCGKPLTKMKSINVTRSK